MSLKVIILLGVVAAVSATKPYVGYPLPFYPQYTGGSGVVESRYGFQVSLQWGIDDPIHFCAGAILDSSWVITTARCASVVPPYGNFVVEVGKYNLRDIESTQQTIRVQRTVIEPRYSGIGNYFDIAMLKLASPITLNSAVKKIKPSEVLISSESGEMISWGSSWRMLMPFAPETLRMTKLNLIKNSDCRTQLKNITSSDDAPVSWQFCGVAETRGFSTCDSEPGAPVITYKGSEPILLGLTSWSVLPCGTPGAPVIFLDISYYAVWIASILKAY